MKYIICLCYFSFLSFSQDLNLVDKDKKKKEGLSIRLYFGPTRTKYKNTDINIQLDNNSNFTIADVPLKERTSNQYWDLRNVEKFQDYFRWIDEPTNTFILELEKGKNSWTITYFHPKYLVAYEWETEENIYHNPMVHITGVHQGQEVDEHIYIHGDNSKRNTPAFPSFRNTHFQVQLGIGYGRKFKILDASKNKKINLTYTPSVHIGTHFGKPVVKYKYFDSEADEWRFRTDDNNGITFQGYGINFGNRLNLTGKRDRLGLYIEHKMNFSKKNYEILDGFGSAEHDLNYQTINFGISYRITGGKK